MSERDALQDGVERPVAREKPSYNVSTGSSLNTAERATILALDSLGVPKGKIADEVGHCRNTVNAVLKRGDFTDPRIVDRVKREMEARFWVGAARAQDAITDEKLEAASALQLMTVAAIGTDKALLLSGRPTVRVEFTGQDDTAMNERIEALSSELEGWKTGQTINVEGEVVDTQAPSSTV